MTVFDPTGKLYRVPLPDAGYVVLVRPLSPLARRAMQLQADELFPLPDARKFDRPAEHALVEGQLIPGEESDAYKAAVHAARIQQANWKNIATLESDVVVRVENEANEDVIAHFADKVAFFRKKMPSFVPANDWTATVMLCLITTVNDVDAIRKAADDVLTEGEVREALDSFRRAV